MKTISIIKSQDYVLHVSTGPVDNLPDYLHLKIESQWLGARDPEGRQTKVSLILTSQEAVQIANLLLDQSEIEVIRVPADDSEGGLV